MGEAARRQFAKQCQRAEAYATGRPWKPQPQCDSPCNSFDVVRLKAGELPAPMENCEHEFCRRCGAIWEAFPAEGRIEDPVCSEPCDNCAFRPGSPEQQDRAGWKRLIETLKPDADGIPTGRFYCHKGVPIDMKKGPGNFLFPQKAITSDGEPILEPSTGLSVMTEDTAKMRTCSGFLRMVWELNRKRDATKNRNSA